MTVSAEISAPRMAESGFGGRASGGTRSGSVSISACSRAFQRPSSSGDGAVPISPGWTIPVNDTPGTCREVAVPPWKSQMTL